MSPWYTQNDICHNVFGPGKHITSAGRTRSLILVDVEGGEALKTENDSESVACLGPDSEAAAQPHAETRALACLHRLSDRKRVHLRPGPDLLQSTVHTRPTLPSTGPPP